MYDFHVHSNFSLDSEASMPSIIDAACNKGLKGLCFTDHLDIDYPVSSGVVFELDFENYIKAIKEMRNIYAGKIEIFSGIEMGLQTHIKEKNSDYLKNKEVDYIIGSIHCIMGKELYGGSFAEGFTDEQSITNYFKDLIDCIDGYNDFDAVGHIDVIRRYLINGEKHFVYNNYKEVIQSILVKLISSNKGIEVNTSGLRYKLSSFHPMTDIIKLYRELGGEIITLGSDAHKPKDIGYHFSDAKAILRDAGFKYYTVFRDRKPHFIKL